MSGAVQVTNAVFEDSRHNVGAPGGSGGSFTLVTLIVTSWLAFADVPSVAVTIAW